MKRMSNKNTFILTEVILGILLIISIGCIMYSKDNQKPEKIVVIVPDVDENQWSTFKYGLKMAAQEYGVNLVIISKDNMENAYEELEVIEQEIDDGADAVIFKPISDGSKQENLKQATGNVPVLMVNDTFYGDKEKLFHTIEPDQYNMGVDLAQSILDDNNGNLQGKKIGIYSEYADSEATEKRKQGVCDTLKNSGAEILWTASRNSDTTEQINLLTQRKVDIVIALDNSSLVEAGKEASENNLGGALVYGMGNSTEALYYLDTGWVECLAVPDEVEAGYQSVSELVKKLRSRTYRLMDREVSYSMLTRENLFAEENKYLLFTISQ